MWYLIQPITTTLVFTVIFGKVAKLPTDGLPQVLFYLSGIIAWRYFSGCLAKTSNTFVGNAGIFGKVYFPRLCVPLSVVISNMIGFSIQFLLNYPMAPIIEAFRYAFLGVGTVDFGSIVTSAVMTVVILAVGIVLFSRIEKSFMDTV